MINKNIGITWQLSEFFGWGIFGFNLVTSMLASKRVNPELLYLGKHDLSIQSENSILSTLNFSKKKVEKYQQILSEKKQILLRSTNVIHAYGNDFTSAHEIPPIVGDKNFGFIFYEQTHFSIKGLQRAKSLDAIMTGSSWNATQLKSVGLKNTFFIMQGVDKNKFLHQEKEKFRDKFVIFSGGKLEFRKGQDIVLVAFREFHKKYPDSLLITCWGNKWPTISADLINSPLKVSIPKIVNNKIDIHEWTNVNGLPPDACIHHEFIANKDLAEVYRNVDVGLFPNRAEGGTNLVAMELMCSGIPCIISHNTGHKDIIQNNNCYPLNQQKYYPHSNMQDWGESSIEEILNYLEMAYHDSQKRKHLGKNAREFISQYSWENQTQQLINVIESYV